MTEARGSATRATETDPPAPASAPPSDAHSRPDGPPGRARGEIRLAEIREAPLSVDEVFAAVGDSAAGGTAVFVGTVRDHDHARAVSALAYSAHPTATETLRAVMRKVADDVPVTALAAVHRVGDLAIGDLAVVVAAASPHRGEAFEACRRLIDDLKEQVPIWKRQRFADGGDEWVGAC